MAVSRSDRHHRTAQDRIHLAALSRVAFERLHGADFEVASMAPEARWYSLTGQPPTVASCGGRYVFNAEVSQPRATFRPSEACPVYTVTQPAAGLVEAKRSRDDAGIAELASAGKPARSYVYLDGSMHPSFRDVLRRSGPSRLQELTSRGVPVSRPEAALAEPRDRQPGGGA